MTICSHMICPFCSSATKIYNSRKTHQGTQTWRRHRCAGSGHVFTTKEKVEWTGQISITSDEQMVEYSRERLLLSLISASRNLGIVNRGINDLCDTIELELQQSGFFNKTNQPAARITEVTTEVLHRFDPNIAIQYVNNVYENKPPLELLSKLINN